MKTRPFAIAAIALAIAAPVAFLGCGGSGGDSQTSVNPNGAEVSPAGDIPDNQAYIAFKPPSGGFTLKVPEGWSRSTQGGAITFTDKLNAIRIETSSVTSAPTVGEGKTQLKKLASSVPGFKPDRVTTVQRNAGPALLLTYSGNGPPDPVTGKSVKDAFERYIFYKGGKLVTLTLSGPVGADDVDPWRIVTDSLSWNT